MNKIFILPGFFAFLMISFSALHAAPVLVETQWLADNIDKKNIVVVDTSDATQNMRFHIPGAVHIDYNELVHKRKKDQVSVQIPNDYFIRLLAQRGISNTSYIVIYDDMGGLNAGRLFWQLEQIGHSQVSVLNGGLVKWIIENRKVSNINNKIIPTVYRANTNNLRDNLASIASLSNKKNLLIDARSKEEYTGHPKYPRSGHIPEAYHWDWQSNIQFDQAFTAKNSVQILSQQKHINLNNKAQPVITYCQSGHRAAQSYLTLRSLGFENVKLYDGSMAEYSLNKSLPLDKGCSHC
ncbi:MAG: rhodanese-like domain-containing protein [Gammaproteobacteria bacterium]|nr:rhodanese-like domain-containing protein [Gammaproteobacteria bacterium]